MACVLGLLLPTAAGSAIQSVPLPAALRHCLPHHQKGSGKLYGVNTAHRYERIKSSGMRQMGEVVPASREGTVARNASAIRPPPCLRESLATTSRVQAIWKPNALAKSCMGGRGTYRERAPEQHPTSAPRGALQRNVCPIHQQPCPRESLATTTGMPDSCVAAVSPPLLLELAG